MQNSRVILIGERDAAKRAHRGIEASLALYSQRAQRSVRFEWVRTDELDTRDAADVLSGATGVWCTPGSPYASTQGALKAIRYARLTGIPFLGTCGGFQHALMEYAASVLKHSAAHQETEPDADSPLIAKLSCSLAESKARVLAKRGSRYEALIGKVDSEEEFNCNYGIATNFEALFDGTDIEFVARDAVGQVRVFWHRSHPFFVGSLFQPERKAFSGEIHPLVYAFIERS